MVGRNPYDRVVAEFEQLQPIFVDGFASLVIRFILVASGEEFFECQTVFDQKVQCALKDDVALVKKCDVIAWSVFERAQTHAVNGTPSQEEPHAKQGPLDMPLFRDAKSLCNDGQLEVATLDKLHPPDKKLLSLTADAVEKLNLGWIPGQHGVGVDPFHEQRTRFFQAPLD